MKNQFVSIWLLFCFPILLAASAVASEKKTDLVLPGNVRPSADLIPLLEKIWWRSRTFRQQCRHIAETHELTVTIRVGIRPGWFHNAQAVTEITRTPDGAMTAAICLFNISNQIELVGHEFEHILEQVEGVPLRSLAARHGSGVYCTREGHYETARAINAGRRVYLEYRNAKGQEF